MENLVTLLNTYFKAFDGIRQELSHTLKGWDTPMIVVFGAQNAGKSSLLERLCMIELFPKGEGLCTRLPIRIRMRTSDQNSAELRMIEVDAKSNEKELDRLSIQANQNISAIVKTRMNNLVNTQQGIRADRLIEVELKRPDLPDIDLLDLPGMVINAGPNDPIDLPQKTYQLVVNTINQTKGRAIYLAVREVGEDPYQSKTMSVLNEIQEIKPYCLGVLTKCDLYADKLILERLQSAKTWDLGYGYVATMNDPDQTSLEDIANAEQKFFNETEKRRSLLSQKNASCNELLYKVKDIYHQYLFDHWLPETLRKLDMNRLSKEVLISSYGEAFNEKSFQEAMSIIQGQLMSQIGGNLIEKIRVINIANHIPQNKYPYSIQSSNLNLSKDIFLKLIIDQNREKIFNQIFLQVLNPIIDEYQIELAKLLSLDYFEDTNRPMKSTFIDVTQNSNHSDNKDKRWFSLNSIISLLKNHNLSKPKVTTNLKIGRFPDLIKHILEENPKENIKILFEKLVDHVINDYLKNNTYYDANTVILRDYLSLSQKMISHLLLNLSQKKFNIDTTQLKTLTQSDDSKVNVENLKQEMIQIQKAIDYFHDLFAITKKNKNIESHHFHLAYQSNLDTNGLMWYLGNANQQINFQNLEKHFTFTQNGWDNHYIPHIFSARQYNNILSKTVENNFLKWEFKSPSLFSLEAYSMMTGDQRSRMMNWQLIGISTFGKEVVLDERCNDLSLQQISHNTPVIFKLPVPSIPICSIKLIRTGNSYDAYYHRANQNNMSISFLEFYGTYYTIS